MFKVVQTKQWYEYSIAKLSLWLLNDQNSICLETVHKQNLFEGLKLIYPTKCRCRWCNCPRNKTIKAVKSVSSSDCSLIELRIEKLLAFTADCLHCNSHQIETHSMLSLSQHEHSDNKMQKKISELLQNQISKRRNQFGKLAKKRNKWNVRRIKLIGKKIVLFETREWHNKRTNRCTERCKLHWSFHCCVRQSR